MKTLGQPIIMQEDVLRTMLRPRPATAHKGTFGHALLVCGSCGMAGAAILAAKGCLRSGIGKLSVHSAAVNLVILQTTVPEAILLNEQDNDAVKLCFDSSPYDAIGIGPGIGKKEQTANALRHYLTAGSKPMVLDADALNIISMQRDLLSLVPKGSILTPHVGELERLVGPCLSVEERLKKALTLATSYGVYVVLKGHGTAICSTDGQAVTCPAGNAGMATAGSGDVLTGIITGLLAQGYKPHEAAMLGVWLHAVAGDFAAEELGQECMLASDIITHLPHAFKRLKNNTI